MWGALLRWMTGSEPRPRAEATNPHARTLRARYDAAQTTDDNRRHWAAADLFSPAASHSAAVRRVIRSRSRYEVANNSYAKGIVLTLANDRIGTGPRLQVYSPDEGANQAFELAWAQWSTAAGLAAKLRTLSHAYDADGEGIAQFITNPRLTVPVKLDLALCEADLLAAPLTKAYTVEGQLHDGIEFDDAGNPAFYWFYDRHPGDPMFSLAQSRRLPADQVIHWFRRDRPGQTRGVPTITPALPLFAELRRYTLAVVGAAETAANFSGILKTTAPSIEPAEVEEWVALEMERRGLTTVPEGWDLSQFKAEQPTTTYGDFKKEIINEIARCLNVPFNVAAGNSSSYNYSSGRLDHQVYHRAIKIDRDALEQAVLMPILRAFVAEYLLTGGRLPPGEIEDWNVDWLWPGFAHVDPTKEANAQQTRLANLTTSLEHEWAQEGEDFYRQLPRIARTHRACIEAGVPSPYGAKPAAAAPAEDPTPDDLEDDDADAEGDRKKQD